jgi:formate hydrogenlyase subunit 3/multisubunit Na+/H+ antiporter MnhD subunit
VNILRALGALYLSIGIVWAVKNWRAIMHTAANSTTENGTRNMEPERAPTVALVIALAFTLGVLGDALIWPVNVWRSRSVPKTPPADDPENLG